VGGSEPPAERSGHLFELLEFWHGALVAQGVCDYSLADARHDLQLAALRCLTTVLQLYCFFQDPALGRRHAGTAGLGGPAWGGASMNGRSTAGSPDGL